MGAPGRSGTRTQAGPEALGADLGSDRKSTRGPTFGAGVELKYVRATAEGAPRRDCPQGGGTQPRCEWLRVGKGFRLGVRGRDHRRGGQTCRWSRGGDEIHTGGIGGRRPRQDSGRRLDCRARKSKRRARAGRSRPARATPESMTHPYPCKSATGGEALLYRREGDSRAFHSSVQRSKIEWVGPDPLTIPIARLPGTERPGASLALATPSEYCRTRLQGGQSLDLEDSVAIPCRCRRFALECAMR